MFIQKNSGLVKNNIARNMTQNKWRTRWYLALINLLIIGGAIVVPGELVLAEPLCSYPKYRDRPCPIPPQPPSIGEANTPQEPPEILEQMQKRYPRAIQQLLKYDPQAIQKLRQALPILQKLQELAPESKEQIQQLISNHRQQQLNQSENNRHPRHP